MEPSTIRSQLKDLVGSCISSYATDVSVQVTSSENVAHGDYSSNIPLLLAKSLKKNPMDIGHALAEKCRISKLPIFQHLTHIEILPPGFINFTLSDYFLYSRLDKLVIPPAIKKQKIMVEYTDPNPFKEFHIGHLYSNAVGESLSRLLKALGNEVKRADYFGDVGMHVAKAIWGMQERISNDFNNSIKKYIDYLNQYKPRAIAELGKAYAHGALEFEQNVSFQNDIKKINTYTYMVAQEENLQNKLIQHEIIDYKKVLGDGFDQTQYENVQQLYLVGKEVSNDYFKKVFKRLGTTFDYYFSESSVSEYGYQIVQDGLKLDVFEKSEGAIIYRGEKDGFHTRVFINSLGLPTYETKEMGLAYVKFLRFPFNQSLSITGNEINEYFKTVMSALSKIEPELAKKTKHIGHGMVRLKTGKMSSRLGNILTGEWLLNEVKQRITAILNQSEKKYSEQEKNDIAEVCAVAAVKYSLLKVSLPSNIDFDIDESINTEGDSGPYLLYTYARCKSVLTKSSKVAVRAKIEKLNTQERALAMLLCRFGEEVEDAALRFAPNILASYLFKLAQSYNTFYAKHQILGNDVRLCITDKTASVLQKGLNLLGIETVEEM